MVTIARVAEKLVEERPFLQEAIARGIINYGSLADMIMPEVKKEMGKEVKHAAVMMALRRLSEKLEKKFPEKQVKGALIDLAVKSNLFEVTIQKTPETAKLTKDLHKLMDVNKGDILNIVNGMHEVTLITNAHHKQAILNVFDKKLVKKKISNVASLTVTIPKSAVDVPGFYFMIFRALAWNNVNIVEVVSTFTELILIMYEDDVMRGYNVLKGLAVKG